MFNVLNIYLSITDGIFGEAETLKKKYRFCRKSFIFGVTFINSIPFESLRGFSTFFLINAAVCNVYNLREHQTFLLLVISSAHTGNRVLGSTPLPLRQLMKCTEGWGKCLRWCRSLNPKWHTIPLNNCFKISLNGFILIVAIDELFFSRVFLCCFACCRGDLLLWVLAVLLVLFCFLDVWYYLRLVAVLLQAWFLSPVFDITAEQSVGGHVLLHDVDMCHMNNARYLRECDFARISLYARNGVLKAVRALGATMVVGATTVRYRRPLCVGEKFELRTRIVTWDEKAFYLEQRFVSSKDGMVAAVMFCKQNVLRSSPDKILQHLCKRKVGNVLKWREESGWKCKEQMLQKQKDSYKSNGMHDLDIYRICKLRLYIDDASYFTYFNLLAVIL